MIGQCGARRLINRREISEKIPGVAGRALLEGCKPLKISPQKALTPQLMVC
jgi:hypothetical protein